MARFAPALGNAKARKSPRAIAPKRSPMLRAHERTEGAFSLAPATAATPAPVIQAKLEIGEPNDEFEKEADAVADHVMRMTDAAAAPPEPPEPTRSGSPTVLQRACAKCEQDDEKLQRDAAPGAGPIVGPAPSGFAQGLAAARAAGGSALPGTVRSFMEPRFGQDFGHVRVHQDARADHLTRSVQARAFTVGNNLFFKQGEFQPSSSSGRRLIAHELTHVVQQRAGVRGVQRELAPASPRRGQGTVVRDASIKNFPHEGRWVVRTNEGGSLRLRVRPTPDKDLPEGPNSVGNISNGTPVTVVKATDSQTEAEARARGFVAVQAEVSLDRGQRRVSIGFVHIDYLKPAATKTAPDPRVASRLVAIILELAKGGEAALDEALQALSNQVDSATFVTVVEAVDAQIGPAGNRRPTNVDLAIERMQVGRNVVGNRAPGLAIPLMVGAADQVTQRFGAFGNGLVAGLRANQLTDTEVERLVGKLAASQVVNLLTAFQIMLAGAVVGAYEDVKGTYKLVAQLYNDPDKIFQEIFGTLGSLLNSNDIAYAFGFDIGKNFVEDIRRLSNDNVVKFTFNIGKLAGPILVAIVLDLITAGVIGTLQAVATRLPTVFKLLQKLPGQSLERLKALASKVRKGARVESTAEATGPLLEGAERLPQGSGHFVEKEAKATASHKLTRTPEEQSFLERLAKQDPALIHDAELIRELELAVRQGGRSSTDSAFLWEYELENGHVWRITRGGRVCRFSKVLCRLLGEDFAPELPNSVRKIIDAERARVGRLGEELGRAAAISDGLRGTDWINPFADQGLFGQGFDDILKDASEHLWIIEYKGGGASLAEGQMSDAWVRMNISRLRALRGNPTWGERAAQWGERLEAARKAGRLHGRVYSTPVDNATGEALRTTRLAQDFHY